MACDCPATNTGTAGRTMTYGNDGTHAGGTLILPASFDSRKTYPLLVVLHGRTDNGTSILSELALLEVQNMDNGVIVWSPTSASDSGTNAWNATNSCCWFGPNPPSEVAYLHTAITAIRADWPIDSHRIWMMGHSNGAFMTQAYVAAHPEVITGFIAINGYIDSAPISALSVPVSFLIVGSTSDTAVLYAGDPTNASGTDVPDAAYLGAVATADAWHAANGGVSSLGAAGSGIDLDSNVAGSETTIQAYGTPIAPFEKLATITGGTHLPTMTAGTNATARNLWTDSLRLMVR